MSSILKGYEGLDRMQEEAAGQLATHPICPSYWSTNAEGVIGEP